MVYMNVCIWLIRLTSFTFSILQNLEICNNYKFVKLKKKKYGILG